MLSRIAFLGLSLFAISAVNANAGYPSDPATLIDQYLARETPETSTVTPIPVPKTCDLYLETIRKREETLWIRVPVDYADPKSEKIWVFFHGDISAARREDTTPLIVHHGGPTSHSYWNADLFRRNVPTLPGIAPIFMSQRGSGQWYDACATPFPSSFQSVSYYEKFTSPYSVMDAEVFRRAVLGGKRWKVLGRSYGQQLAHATLQYFPDTVVAAFIDAFAVPRDSRLSNTYVQYYRATRYQAFFKANPDLKAKIVDAIRAEETKAMPEDNPMRLTEIFDTEEEQWLYDPVHWKELRERIEERLASREFTRELPAFKDTTTYLGGKAANWALAILELTTAEDRAGDPWGDVRGVVAAHRWLKDQDADLAFIYERAKYPSLANAYPGWSFVWIARLFDERSPPPVTLEKLKAAIENRHIPITLYAGISDNVDSPYLFCPEVTALGKLVRFKLRSGGHPAGYENPELWKDLLAPADAPASGTETDGAEYCRDAEAFAKGVAQSF